MTVVLAMYCMLMLPLAVFVGWKLHERKSIDYKGRWKEALRLLDEERVKPLPEGTVPTLPQSATASEKTLKQITRKPYFNRQSLEASRLKNGLPPIDPLTGMPGFAYEQMVKLRYKYGYDEEGRKFK